MKTVQINKRSRVVKELLDLAKQEDVVLQTSDGEEYLLSVIEDLEQEIERQNRNKNLTTFLDERFRRARQENAIPIAEVKRQLNQDSDDN